MAITQGVTEYRPVREEELPKNVSLASNYVLYDGTYDSTRFRYWGQDIPVFDYPTGPDSTTPFEELP